MPVAGDLSILKRMTERARESGYNPLDSLIDEYLMKRDASEHRVNDWVIDMSPRPRPGGRISPSAVGECQRKAAFRFVGMRGRRRVNPDLEMLFEDGNWRHHKWQALFKDMEAVLGADVFEVLAYEEAVQIPRWYVAGSLDVRVRIRGEVWIIDIKGINNWGFLRVTSTGDGKVQAVRQIITYCEATGVDNGVLLYDGKDTNLRKLITVRDDHAEWPEALRWIKKVVRALREAELPDMHPDATPTSMMCKECPYARHCYGDRTARALERIAYKNYEGIDATWEAGLAVEAAWAADRLERRATG